MKPLRVGFISTPSMTMSEPSQIRPAAMMKAAELGSPGTVMAAPCSSASPQMVTERPPVGVVLQR